MTFATIGVVGAGTMGAGIAQVALEGRHNVVVVDAIDAALQSARGKIAAGLERRVSKGTLSAEERDGLMAALRLESNLEALASADFVIEAVPEDFEIKRRVFEVLDRTLPAGAIIASNTSSLSITRLAALTGRPDRVVGMHFFNPAPVMALVEVVRGLTTSNATISDTAALARDLGKTPIEVKDSPGFILNRLLIPMINEAVYVLMEGIADAESIDAGMRSGANFPMGPLALADLIGLDVCLAIMRVLHADLGEDKYRPCPLLVRMVDAGQLGRKTGRGFFDYARKD